MCLDDEHIVDIRKRRAITDDTSKPDLPIFFIINAKAQRVLDRSFNYSSGNPARPHGLATQKVMHEPNINPSPIRGEEIFPSPHFPEFHL